MKNHIWEFLLGVPEDVSLVTHVNKQHERIMGSSTEVLPTCRQTLLDSSVRETIEIVSKTWSCEQNYWMNSAKTNLIFEKRSFWSRFGSVRLPFFHLFNWGHFLNNQATTQTCLSDFNCTNKTCLGDHATMWNSLHNLFDSKCNIQTFGDFTKSNAWLGLSDAHSFCKESLTGIHVLSNWEIKLTQSPNKFVIDGNCNSEMLLTSPHHKEQTQLFKGCETTWSSLSCIAWHCFTVATAHVQILPTPTFSRPHTESPDGPHVLPNFWRSPLSQEVLFFVHTSHSMRLFCWFTEDTSESAWLLRQLNKKNFRKKLIWSICVRDSVITLLNCQGFSNESLHHQEWFNVSPCAIAEGVSLWLLRTIHLVVLLMSQCNLEVFSISHSLSMWEHWITKWTRPKKCFVKKAFLKASTSAIMWSHHPQEKFDIDCTVNSNGVNTKGSIPTKEQHLIFISSDHHSDQHLHKQFLLLALWRLLYEIENCIPLKKLDGKTDSAQQLWRLQKTLNCVFVIWNKITKWQHQQERRDDTKNQSNWISLPKKSMSSEQCR